ncbi:MAG TPA: hypothetical protein DEO60_07910 [Bacteroidales bacterium]|nr:hypothetical protein [Bacteroidales bacterium]
MPKKPPNLFIFWNELKRRKVIKASFVYIAVAYAIIQAADIVFPRLGLPDWTVTFVLILLIIIFILVIVLTWVYDITPEGIKVTEDIGSGSNQEKGKKSAKSRKQGAPDAYQKPVPSQSELEKKVSDLEAQLHEANSLSLSKVLPLFVKKLALPVIVIVALGLFVIYKQKISEMLGFGDEKREVAMTHNANAAGYIKNGDIESASHEVELALESDPEYSYAWSNKGVISYLQGDLDKAINEIIKAVSLDPRNSKAPYNLAYALDDRKDYKQAVRWYKEAIRIDSTFNTDSVYTIASSALGRLYNTFEQPAAAIVIFSRAKKLHPESKYIYLIHKNLGNAYLLQHQTDSALKYLELSYNINKLEPETNLFLARAYEASGQTTKSIESWQKYINLETDTIKAGEAKKRMKELAVKRLQEIIKN